jgi:hypothetical protein
MNPFRRSCLLSLSALAFAAGVSAETAQPAAAPKPLAPKVDFPAASPSCTIKQRVGFTDIEIVYSRPGVKGRTVFGGLEAFGKVWRTGANSATRITFSTPVKFGGVDVAAGTYGLFSIPGVDEWTVILNKDPGQWGAYKYDEKQDLVRVKTKPITLTQPMETFTIGINDIRDDSATLNLVWQNTRVPVTLGFDVVNPVTAQIEAAMASDGDKKPYAQAAMFYLEHNLDLKKALTWMDTAIAAQPDAFYFIYHKARILAKMGDKAGAIATAKQSIEIAAKAGGTAKEEYTRLNETLIAGLK